MVVSKYKTNKDCIKIVVDFDDTISTFLVENDEIVLSKYTTILIKSLFYILKQPRCLSSEFILCYTANWPEEGFAINKVKNTVILKGKKFFERFAKNNCKEKIKKSSELKNK